MPTPLFLPRRAPEAPSAPAARRFSGAAARGREAASLLLAAASAFAALALASFEAHPGRPEARGPDWVGPVGASLAGALVGTIGVVAWALVLEFALLAWPLLRGRASRATLARLAGDIVIMLIAAALVHVAAPEARAFGELAAGGALGELFGELLRSLFSTLGSFLVGLTAVGLVLIGRSSLSLTAWLEEARRLALLAARWLVVGYHALADLIRRWTTPVPVEVGAVAAEGAADLGSWGRQDGGPAWGREDGWGRDASTPPAPDARGGAPDTGSPPPAKAPSDPATSAPARRTRGRARAEEPDALAPPAPAGPVVVATRARNASRAALIASDADEPRAENERPA
ncbi:MAG TPA: DNA translocase FtsK 4TM domain-containing protein, partial [Polyangiaceae bacterium]|nr:DNA translocase FtsK 4TM domain-containing protein [Polyangiaceae bacterium]